MKKRIWTCINKLSFVPFVFPLLMWTFELLMRISSWDFIDFIVLYSFVYWPTYVLGLIGVFVSTIFLKKK